MIKNILVALFIITSLTACQTVEYRHGSLDPLTPLSQVEGIYHKVQKGETLWRIAKTYDVEINDLVTMNNIPNAALIEENQLVFVPYADKQIETQPIVLQSSSDDFLWPVKGQIISYFNDVQGLYANRGINIEGQAGDKVIASRSGNVVFADILNGYVNTLIINHRDGFYTVYGNNSRLLVGLGDNVSQGQEIAQLGAVGHKAFVHFEVREGNKANNPLFYLP